ncbi:MAG: hydantoinase B/oxoprolinase family protein, partial [Pseudomonadota bacterium]
LGQLLEIAAARGGRFDSSALFDRLDHPARGRAGGLPGAPTTLAFDDGTPMRGKGRQAAARGARVLLACPGGGGYGPPSERDRAAIRRDLALGYVTPEAAAEAYGLSADEIAAAMRGDDAPET